MHSSTSTVAYLHMEQVYRDFTAIALSMSPGDELLGEDDCFNILQELEPVAYRWHDIGLALGLRDSTLQGIKSNDVHSSLRRTIVEWLKMSYNVEKFGKPTWRRIVEAVGASFGGRDPALADALARKYCVTIQVTQPDANPTSQQQTSIVPPKVHTGICCCSSLSNNQTQGKESPLLRRSFSLSNSGSRESSFIHQSLEESKVTIPAHPTWQIRDITQERGYVGTTTAANAEEHLKRCGSNCYLLRYSETHQHYVISVMRTDIEHPMSAIQHYKLKITQDGDHSVYEIEGTEQKFTDISLLLEFYQQHPLTRSKRTIGEAYTQRASSLLKP